MSTTPWLVGGGGLKKTFTWKNFPESVAFVREVAVLAEAVNHHPDIDIRWNQVHLTLLTHDAGDTVTDKDWTLAGRIDAIPAERVQARGAEGC